MLITSNSVEETNAALTLGACHRFSMKKLLLPTVGHKSVVAVAVHNLSFTDTLRRQGLFSCTRLSTNVSTTHFAVSRFANFASTRFVSTDLKVSIRFCVICFCIIRSPTFLYRRSYMDDRVIRYSLRRRVRRPTNANTTCAFGGAFRALPTFKRLKFSCFVMFHVFRSKCR